MYRWFIAAGLLLGVLAALLVSSGNPGNMGVCAACFLRDSAGALGLHSAGALQYLRPEILGLIIGGFLASLFWTKEFRASASKASFSDFLFGLFAMIGALVFLGCPWRAFLRLGGGDMTAIAGVLGLAAGVGVGMIFKSRGYKVSEPVSSPAVLGFLPIIIAVLGLVALFFGLKVGENGALFSSVKGPGAMHAPLLFSLIAGAAIGAVMHKSKFCSVGAISGAMRGDFKMFSGVIAIIAGASVMNAILGQYHFGFENQPIAHNEWVWNFLGMVLSGLCFSLAGGCPGKHLVQMGAGNLGSAVFIIGMIAGAAVAHNFLLASSPNGITAAAPWALLIGFIYACFVGFRVRFA